MTSEFGIAVHALVYLNHKARTLSSEELAENICTNPARVRKIMALLKRAGLIETKEGAEGGYLFCRKAEEVTLSEVGKALGTAFVSVSWKAGTRIWTAISRPAWRELWTGFTRSSTSFAVNIWRASP